MGIVKVETPPTFKGEQTEKLAQVISYLYRLSENLNVALNNLSSDNYVYGYAPGLQGKASGGGAKTPEKSQYEELKELIINTAEIVRAEEVRLTKQLESNYEAISSDFGTFKENIQTTITETAESTIASYNYDASITALQNQADAFTEYQRHTEGFIQQGFIGYDDGNPIVGIAIGQDLATTGTTAGGYEEIQTQHKSVAFYTAGKITFYIDGNAVAYFSQDTLYITDIEMTGKLTQGRWVRSDIPGAGLVLKWIG